jgi:hypothetical protein
MSGMGRYTDPRISIVNAHARFVMEEYDLIL